MPIAGSPPLTASIRSFCTVMSITLTKAACGWACFDETAMHGQRNAIYACFLHADQENWREAFAFALPVIGLKA